MAEGTLTMPLDIPVSAQQLANLLCEEPATLTRLLLIREIHEDESGATLRFQQGDHGRLALRDANYATYLRLARRSHERQHPIGVSFGEEQAIRQLIRADHDVPAQLWEEHPDRARVLFQGHDGVYRLKPDHPESARILALLGEALRQNARVWFIAQQPDLALLDVQPAGWEMGALQTSEGVPFQIKISLVGAPDHLLRTADEILRAGIRCTKALRRDIRAVAKAYIDEADELKRAAREIQTHAARVQIESRSPQDMVERANRLRTVQLANKELQEQVRAVANSYVLIAEKNQQLFEEFKERYRDKLPPID